MGRRLKKKTRKRENFRLSSSAYRNQKTRNWESREYPKLRRFVFRLIVSLILVAPTASADNEEGNLVEIELGNEDKITITKYSPGSRPVETSMFGPGFFIYSIVAKPQNAEEYMYMPIPEETSLFIYKNKRLIKTETGPTVLYYKLSDEKAISIPLSPLQLPEGYQDAIAKAADIGSISNEYPGKLSKRLDWIDEKTHRLVTGISIMLNPQTISAYKFGASAGKVQMSLLNGKGEPIKEPINATVLNFDQTLLAAADEQKQISWAVTSPNNYFLLIWNEHTQPITVWITSSHISESSIAYRGTLINFRDIVNTYFCRFARLSPVGTSTFNWYSPGAEILNGGFSKTVSLPLNCALKSFSLKLTSRFPFCGMLIL